MDEMVKIRAEVVKDTPPVSVVLCTYNGEKFIREQLDSILNQTYPVDELIIQDDGSNDDTLDIIREYQKKYSQIKLYCNESPLGFNYNFSTAFRKASGDYIASCDQDDIWRKDKIEVLIKHIRDNKLIFHNSLLFTSTIDSIIGVKNPSHIVYNELFLALKPFVPGHECFFKRDILSMYESIVVKERNFSYDSLLLIISSVLGSVDFVNEGLVYWRRHPEATSYRIEKHMGSLKGLYLALRAYNDKHKRTIMVRYFRAIKGLPWKDAKDKKIISIMGKGSFMSMCHACILCMMNRKKLYPNYSFIQSCIKSFFTPFYFLRDNTAFVIH